MNFSPLSSSGPGRSASEVRGTPPAADLPRSGAAASEFQVKRPDLLGASDVTGRPAAGAAEPKSPAHSTGGSIEGPSSPNAIRAAVVAELERTYGPGMAESLAPQVLKLLASDPLLSAALPLANT